MKREVLHIGRFFFRLTCGKKWKERRGFGGERRVEMILEVIFWYGVIFLWWNLVDWGGFVLVGNGQKMSD